MTNDPIEEGDEVFLADGSRHFGAVRHVRPAGRKEFVIYVENAGEFTVPLDAVDAVHFKKVIVHFDKLDHRLQRAIKHARDREERNS